MAEDESLDLDVDESGGSNKKMVIIFAVLIFVAVVGTGAGMYFFLQPKGAASTDGAGGADAAPVVVQKKEAIYHQMKPAFIVNFKADGKQHFLQVSLSVMARERDAIDAVRTHTPLLRNNLVLLFSTQNFTNLQTPEGKDVLRQLALEEVQGLVEQEIGRPGIEQVLFTNFVMQ
ncbi:MAG: hypothetical protein COB04_01780 [Gammaproteobacteria bacterium]|nr:MAG: hypothetical protein COB04_01780 [Gammaproteobacteria bacterium]